MAEKAKLIKPLIKLFEYTFNRSLVVLTEVRYGTEIRSELADEPHNLYVPVTLRGYLTGRANTIEIRVYVQLQKVSRIISRRALFSRSAANEAQLAHVQ